MPHPYRTERVIRPASPSPCDPPAYAFAPPARLIRRYGLAPWLRLPLPLLGLPACRRYGLASRPGFALPLPLFRLPGVFTALRHSLAPVVRAFSLLATALTASHRLPAHPL
jgi:hypothetical protein